ncbi:uncharacterized protein LOC120130623 [Hibiscus syriacus]|uniref:uncharacterized protein LOC120130623 n=1 Tax=Hibiscus syriacus TaxID=106335 RepID=UPI001922DEFD|nr:uncharacterized protein LOC120130623 [Hibiscus syriacus]
MGEAVSKFIIYDRLPFRLASSPWLYNLIQVAIEVGKGVKLPTPYEISYVYLTSEYEQVREWVNELKTHWKQLGATLMCDGWTNSLNQMHIINFLVYCSKGTIFWKSVDVSSVRSRYVEFYYNLLDKVVEEIGEEYIIQIVTDNEAAMKAAGKRLMLKRNHLYWTSCATHCLDLCLEDIGKKSNVAKVLEEAKKLEEITMQKQGLREMFKSKEFRESKWGQQKSGPAYEAKKIVLGKDFWKKAVDIIKVYKPLVKVLRLVDGDEKPTIGFIYEAIDRAKRAIKENCRYSIEYEKIIDNRWNFMYSDLHSAAEWWMIYGTCTPELQRLAIKVLSQTTSASNCERNWITFSYIHTKARNRLKYKKLEKLVFTYYNMRLKMRHQKRMRIDDINASYNPISIDNIFEDVDSLSEWLQEKENPLLDGENAGVLPVDTSDDEMNVDDQSQQQNLSHSSSSATPSQSGDGPDGGGLSPIDDDDRQSGDGVEFRSSDWYGEEYVYTGRGHFCASSSRERNEPRARSKGKGKDTRKHTSEGSSSGRRSTPSNLRQSSYFQPPHGFYPQFPNYGVPYQPQMYPPPLMYHPPPPHMYPPPQVYPPSQLFENQGEIVTFFGYIFGQRPHRSSGDHSQSEGEGSDLPRYSTNW